MHTVVPAVLIVEGVLNGAFVSREEIGKFAEAWNGRPVPILHPMVEGQPVSASSSPDILERTAGLIFGAKLDVDRLRGELWLDEQKMDALGESAMIGHMLNGDKVYEVSTGYFSDVLVQPGVWNGKPYAVKHENLRPDHLALLPGEIGACSVADGCGAPRVNVDQSVKAKIAAGFALVLNALGMKPTDCSCEVQPMKASEIVAAALAINKRVAEIPALKDLAVNFDVAELEKMSDAGRAAVMGAIKALEKAANAAAEMPMEDPAKKPAANAAAAAAAAATPITHADVAKLVADGVAAGLKAHAVEPIVQRILANSANVIPEGELRAMSLATLQKLEVNLQPVDYGLQGAGVVSLVANSNDPEDAPLVANAAGGVLVAKKAAA